VPFNDITSCRYSANGEDKYLRIKRKDSTTFRLSDKSEEFAAMIKELESTLVFYQQPAAVSLLASETGDKDAIANQLSSGKTPLILREKTFFEKPVANVLGWIITAGLCYFSWHLFQSGVKDGKWGSAFMIYGNGLAYLAAWRNAQSKKAEDQ
jgi:hypothetical protein